MARIRTIKPQFWDDEKVGRLALGARLLFIATWNFADDKGIFPWDSTFLKNKVFPHDKNITTHHIGIWMRQLSTLGLVQVARDCHSIAYGLVINWSRHQKINRPQPSDHDLIFVPKNSENSLNIHGTFTDDSLLEGEGRGRERKDNINNNSGTDEIFTSYEKNIGALTPIISEKLIDLEKEYGRDWLLDAIKKATTLEKRSAGYIEGILKGWKRDGRGPPPNQHSLKNTKGGANAGNQGNTKKHEYTDQDYLNSIGKTF